MSGYVFSCVLNKYSVLLTANYAVCLQIYIFRDSDIDAHPVFLKLHKMLMTVCIVYGLDVY